MNTNNIYYQSNKERLQKQAQNCDHQKSWKEEAKEYIKITRKDCKNKQEINIKNYPIKKRI